jgi:hypothetical protein
MFLFVRSPGKCNSYWRSVYRSCSIAMEILDNVASVWRSIVLGRDSFYAHMKHDFAEYGALSHATRELSWFVVATRIMLLSRVSNGIHVSQITCQFMNFCQYLPALPNVSVDSPNTMKRSYSSLWYLAAGLMSHWATQVDKLPGKRSTRRKCPVFGQ